MSQYVTFTLCDSLYGIEVSKVQEVLRRHDSTNVPMAADAVTGLVNLRGQVVTLIDLRKQLSLPPRGEGESSMMVVVIVDGEMVSLLVDKIIDVREVKDKDFETPPDTLSVEMRELILGAYKLQGDLLLALDVERVVSVGIS